MYYVESQDSQQRKLLQNKWNCLIWPIYIFWFWNIVINLIWTGFFFSGNENNNSDAGGYNNRRTPPHRRFHQVAVNQHAVIRRSYTPSPATSLESSPGPSDPQGRRPSPTLPLGQTQPSMDTENIKKIGNYYECTICGARSTSTAEMGKHSQGRRHRLGVVTAELKKQRSDTELHL